MKKILLVILLLIALSLIGCSKQPTSQTDPHDTVQSYPFVDDEGRLNVESNHQFGWGDE